MFCPDGHGDWRDYRITLCVGCVFVYHEVCRELISLVGRPDRFSDLISGYWVAGRV